MNLINKYSKLLRYLAVGVTAYLTEMVTLYILLKVVNLSAVSSVAISFWSGFFVAFTLQKLITFNNKEKHATAIARQLILYSLLVAFNYAFSLIVVSALDQKLNVLLIRTITIAIITCWNFIIYNKYIFPKKQNEAIIQNRK